MPEYAMWVSGAIIATLYLRTLFKRYYNKPLLERRHYPATSTVVHNRPTIYLGTNNTSSVEYPSSTYVTARLPHMYLRDYHI